MDMVSYLDCSVIQHSEVIVSAKQGQLLPRATREKSCGKEERVLGSPGRFPGETSPQAPAEGDFAYFL